MGSYQTEVLLYSLAVGLFIYFTWWILCFSSLAKSDSESVQVAPQNYTFRIRFNRSPTDAIECAENEIWTSPASVDIFQLPVRSCSNASGLSWSR